MLFQRGTYFLLLQLDLNVVYFTVTFRDTGIVGG